MFKGFRGEVLVLLAKKHESQGKNMTQFPRHTVLELAWDVMSLEDRRHSFQHYAKKKCTAFIQCAVTTLNLINALDPTKGELVA